ncbi:hypothetical protein SMD44_07387 [Streptomyces alboflavus]|uniref:Uncharacterized protein n=1 Tax=Streptomyces alboflavus TaxID=67267 RepID=A0A1Z1WNJ2_9ACTN|nr:hypothetical protein SMD44_07387 [Streptomyces alboflavus]
MSETMFIQQVDTSGGGRYFLVVESDIVSPEDEEALRELSARVGAHWRQRILESDYYGRPHERFPFSREFVVHVVHPDYRPE